MDVLGDINLFEVDWDDLGTSSLGKSESGGDSIDHVDFLGSFEESESGCALLEMSAGSCSHKTVAELTPIGPAPQIPTISPSSTPVSTTEWYAVGRTSERTIGLAIVEKEQIFGSTHTILVHLY